MAKVERSKRFRKSPSAPKPGFSPMAEPLRRLATVATIAAPVWDRPEADRALPIPTRERVTVSAELTDGRIVARCATLAYDPHIREAIVEGARDENKAAHGLALARQLLDRRSRAAEKLRAEIQRTYSGCPAR